MEVKVIRLSSGEDIISKVQFLDNGAIHLDDPMVFMVKDTGRSMNLLMQHWLPVNMLESNEAHILAKDIITVCNPSKQFSEYYSNTVDKYNSVVDSVDDETTEEEEIKILEAMEEIRKESRIIH